MCLVRSFTIGYILGSYTTDERVWMMEEGKMKVRVIKTNEGRRYQVAQSYMLRTDLFNMDHLHFGVPYT
jgi:hypothetical protein